jgi:hypothetical protein
MPFLLRGGKDGLKDAFLVVSWHQARRDLLLDLRTRPAKSLPCHSHNPLPHRLTVLSPRLGFGLERKGRCQGPIDQQAHIAMTIGLIIQPSSTHSGQMLFQQSRILDSYPKDDQGPHIAEDRVNYAMW